VGDGLNGPGRPEGGIMAMSEALRPGDDAVVARYLQLRTAIHDRHLARVERVVLERYLVQPTKRIHPTLVAHVRTGFLRPGEGELWPVFFLTPVDISVGLCVELSPERVAELGTTLNGPQRLRRRNWQDWWGWERPIAALHPQFFELPAAQQEDVVAGWFDEALGWLAANGLLRRKP
jgi:hypothetical protein